MKKFAVSLSLILFLISVSLLLIVFSKIRAVDDGFWILIIGLILSTSILLVIIYLVFNKMKSKNHLIVENSKVSKYYASGLSKELSFEYKEKLIVLMNNKMVYLNEKFSLNDLAIELSASRHHTSQVINEHFGVSFYEFINKYRIEEAKSLLLEDKGKGSITEIVYKSGFSNKASFYNEFKKYTNLTPKKFIINEMPNEYV